MEKTSYVYMMGSTSRRVLYTGVTAFFYLRVWQHKNNQGGYFTSKYKCYRLVYFEQFTNVEAAIAREKEIKGWRREKKDNLVESVNPGWKDLAADWYPEGLMKDGVLVDFKQVDFKQNENIRSLRATRPLKTARDSLTPFGMTNI
jgi:putative endonuclease